MTTGLALGAIPRLGETLAPPTAEGPQTDGADLAVPRIMASGAEYLAVRAADIQGQESLPNPSDDLRGLVAVIAIYLIKGSSNWPRARAKFISNVLRARTDFAEGSRNLRAPDYPGVEDPTGRMAHVRPLGSSVHHSPARRLSR
jgi:hypothetical protein